LNKIESTLKQNSNSSTGNGKNKLSRAAVKRKSSSSKTKSGAEHEHSPDQTVAAKPRQGPSHSGIKAKRRLTKLNLARGSEAKASSKNEVADSKIRGELALLSGRHSIG
jgi:hypothetical protein